MGKAVKINHPVNKGVAKVPTVMQLEALECGAACLTMVMAYYSLWIPLEQVRKDCGVSRDGSCAKNILIAARNRGFIASAYKLSPEIIKEQATFPCIIHWNFNHFVVLNGYKNKKFYLNDPARGTVAVSEEEFDEAFTGICLMIEPGENFEPGGSPKSVLSFARERLKGTGSAVAFAVIMTLITYLLQMINPAFSRVFIDRLLTGRNPEWVVPFIYGLSALTVIQILVMFLQTVYSLKINGKLAIYGNTSYMWKILRLPMEFYSQRMAGDIQGRMAGNATIADTLVNSIAPLALNFIMMIFYLVIMLRYSPILTIIGLLSIVCNIFLSGVISKKRVNITRVQMRDEGKLAGTTVSGIEMIETIKASGAENGFFEKWSGYQASVNTQKIRYEKLEQYLGVLPSLINELASDVVLILGVFLIIQGEMTIGMLMAFQGFLNSFTGPAQELINTGQTVQEMKSQMERVEDVMKYPDDVVYETDKRSVSEADSYEKLTGNIELRNITFGYSPLAAPLIEDFSMTLKPGSRVAFVGASGCGKSTLAKLISGLYQPWSGEMYFDGKKRSEIDRSVFTGSLAVVDQDIILFEDTISNNIKMWDDTIEDFEVILAARDAQIHDAIMRREGNYNYKVTEGGKDFSGGERQRIEIARVLAQDPTIIILDEATSALDAQTEFEVVKAIKDRGITCIVIAHRLSTIRDCDEIIVMDAGRVVERGTHEELFALGGRYTELVTSE